MHMSRAERMETIQQLLPCVTNNNPDFKRATNAEYLATRSG
jgi:hypothetical protein